MTVPWPIIWDWSVFDLSIFNWISYSPLHNNLIIDVSIDVLIDVLKDVSFTTSKRNMIFNTRNIIYKLPGKLPNSLTLRITLNKEIAAKSQNCIGTQPGV